MKLAVSNIAWPAESDRRIAEMLSRLEVSGLEVAPTKVWQSPLAVTPVEARSFRKQWANRGVQVVAAQSLLFGRPDLTIFENDATRRKTLEYLRRMLALCSDIGARALVFGSPKNRRIGERSTDEVQRIALEFFGELAQSAEVEGVVVVLEANPTDYGADFIVRAEEALALVNRIGRSGLRFHADAACMTMSADPVEQVLRDGAEAIEHFHASEPYLAPVGGGKVDHERFAAALRDSAYCGWVSLEMREPQPFDPLVLERSIVFAQRAYLGRVGGT